jgi:tetratricopeptide (TPR) repeat protein
MQNPNMDETSPSPVERDEQAAQPEDTQQSPVVQEMERDDETSIKAPRRGLFVRRVAIGVVLFLLIVALGAFGGYQTGIGDRLAFENIEKSTAASDQYQIALTEFEAGDYDRVIQRLEYIIRLDPSYPGAADLLTKALLARNSTATPAIAPTATVTPTPDNRGEEDLFQQALAYSEAEDWDALLGTLDSIRKANPDYRTVDVDGLYYLGLRSRGVKRILEEGNLEGGIFDLNLAEKFAPLDAQAVSIRQWAEWYITGASFWEIDWSQVITYFENIVPQAPNIMDGSNFTAQDRLATAQIYYATQAIIEGDALLAAKEWCAANEKYQYVANSVGVGADIQATVDWAAYKCEYETSHDN